MRCLGCWREVVLEGLDGRCPPVLSVVPWGLCGVEMKEEVRVIVLQRPQFYQGASVGVERRV